MNLSDRIRRLEGAGYPARVIGAALGRYLETQILPADSRLAAVVQDLAVSLDVIDCIEAGVNPDGEAAPGHIS